MEMHLTFSSERKMCICEYGMVAISYCKSVANKNSECNEYLPAYRLTEQNTKLNEPNKRSALAQARKLQQYFFCYFDLDLTVAFGSCIKCFKLLYFTLGGWIFIYLLNEQCTRQHARWWRRSKKNRVHDETENDNIVSGNSNGLEVMYVASAIVNPAYDFSECIFEVKWNIRKLSGLNWPLSWCLWMIIICLKILWVYL